MMNTWSFLEDVPIYCISLREREDRYDQSRAEFERVGLLPKVKYYRPYRHPRGGRHGCWFAHKEVLRRFVASGASTCLIFEDDVLFTEDWHAQLPSVEKMLTRDWNIFYLGGIVFRVLSEETDGVLRAECMTTHAYFMARKCALELLARAEFNPYLYKYLSIDSFYRGLPGCHILFEPICIQRNVESDNAWGIPFQSILQKYIWSQLFEMNSYCARLLGTQNYLNPYYWMLSCLYAFAFPERIEDQQLTT